MLVKSESRSTLAKKAKEDYEMQIENIHLGYLKYMLHVNPSSCTPAIYAECGRFPLMIKHKCNLEGVI